MALQPLVKNSSILALSCFFRGETERSHRYLLTAPTFLNCPCRAQNLVIGTISQRPTRQFLRHSARQGMKHFYVLGPSRWPQRVEIRRRRSSVINEWRVSKAVVRRNVGQHVTQSFPYDFGVIVGLQGKPTLSINAKESA